MAGVLARVLRRKPVEQRDSSFYYPSSLSFAQRLGVSHRTAETIASAHSCIALISNAISSLPVSLTTEAPDGGRAPAPRTATAWALLERPNAFMSWPSFARWATWQTLCHGNAVAALGTDGRGAVNELRPIAWTSLSPQIIASSGSRRLIYDVTAQTAETAGLPRRLLDSDVCHIRTGHTDGGILGQSALRAGGPVREAQELETLVSALWSQSLRPSGILSMPGYMSDVQRTRYGDTFTDKFMGNINAGKIPLIEGGLKYEAMAGTAQESELLGSRAHNIADVARLFGIPEMLVQTGQRSLADPTPYLQLFVSQCLAPLVVEIEAQFSHSVLPAGLYLQMDMTGLQRGSFSQIAAALVATTGAAITTANEARAAMGFPAHPDGNALRVNGALPADRLGMPAMGDKPGPTGDGVAMPSHENEGSQGRPNGKATKADRALPPDRPHSSTRATRRNREE